MRRCRGRGSFSGEGTGGEGWCGGVQEERRGCGANQGERRGCGGAQGNTTRCGGAVENRRRCGGAGEVGREVCGGAGEKSVGRGACEVVRGGGAGQHRRCGGAGEPGLVLRVRENGRRRDVVGAERWADNESGNWCFGAEVASEGVLGEEEVLREEVPRDEVMREEGLSPTYPWDYESDGER